MRPGATFDQSKALSLYARIGEAGVPVVLVFKDATGAPYPIDGFDFELPVYRNITDDEPAFTLTLGDGLTIQGDDLNKLRIEISRERSLQRAESHFFLIREVDGDHSWFNGPFTFHRGEFDGITEAEITNGMDITITVETAGGGNGFQGSYDASVNEFPDSDNLTPGDWYSLSVGGDLPNPTDPEFIPAGSLIFYLGDAAWRIVT